MSTEKKNKVDRFGAACDHHRNQLTEASYIRECQEKHLPLGSVPKDFSFSLGIQPN